MRSGVIGQIGRAGIAVAALGALGVDGPPRATPQPKRVRPQPADDATFRPTVYLRGAKGTGTGTLIATGRGESLVLTAAHVVRENPELDVELHRYNFGLEGKPTAGRWPRVVRAEVLAADPDGDVAVLRIRRGPLPYVARLAEADRPLVPDEVVTSVGIERGPHLTSWSAKLKAVARFRLAPGKQRGTFLVTDFPPDHGRSGGGLYDRDRRLIGVCVGRIDTSEGPKIGIFAAGEGIHRLLLEHDLDAAIPRPEARKQPAPAAPKVAR